MRERAIAPLIDQFLRLETEQDLWSRKVGSFDYWHYLRAPLFELTTEQLGLQEYRDSDPEDSYVDRFLERRPRLPALAMRYNYARLTQRDLVSLNPLPLTQHGSRSLSPHTHLLSKRLPFSYWDLQLAESAANVEGEQSPDTLYVDALFEASRKGYALLRGLGQISEEIPDQANQISGLLHRKLEVRISPKAIAPIISDAMAIDRGWGRACGLLLDRTRPQAVLVLKHHAPSVLAFTRRAKQRSIPVVELQHSAITQEHIAYRYPEQLAIDGRPDYFLSWGSFWSRMLDGFGLPESHIKATGFAWLERQAKPTKQKGPPNERTLLVISQPSVGSELSQLVVQAAPALQAMGWRITYRLHPAEVRSWRHRMPGLSDSGVTISRPQARLYEEFQTASAVLGVNSTALFEGLAFSLPTLIARLPGSHGMQPLVNHGAARFVGDAKALEEELRDGLDWVNEDLSRSVWQPNAPARFHAFMAGIVRKR